MYEPPQWLRMRSVPARLEGRAQRRCRTRYAIRRPVGWARERRAGFAEAVRLAHRDPVFFASQPDITDRPRSEGDARLLDWLVGLPKPVGVMAGDD